MYPIIGVMYLDVNSPITQLTNGNTLRYPGALIYSFRDLIHTDKHMVYAVWTTINLTHINSNRETKFRWNIQMLCDTWHDRPKWQMRWLIVFFPAFKFDHWNDEPDISVDWSIVVVALEMITYIQSLYILQTNYYQYYFMIVCIVQFASSKIVI